VVRAEGLEPPRLSSPEPKSGASTNSATPASRCLAWENPPLWAPSIASWAACARKKRAILATWICRGNRLVPDQNGDRDGEQSPRHQNRRRGVTRLDHHPTPGRKADAQGQRNGETCESDDLAHGRFSSAHHSSGPGPGRPRPEPGQHKGVDVTQAPRRAEWVKLGQRFNQDGRR
jgi:hypothetical protein